MQLTEFDRKRQVRPLLDDAAVTRNAQGLDMLLTCSICLGFIHDATTVMECLHRFCSDCLNKTFRQHKKECPSCRTHCASRRSLKKDTNFDALIRAIYPDIERIEEEQNELNQRLIRSSSHAMASTARRALKRTQRGQPRNGVDQDRDTRARRRGRSAQLLHDEEEENGGLQSARPYPQRGKAERSHKTPHVSSDERLGGKRVQEAGRRRHREEAAADAPEHPLPPAPSKPADSFFFITRDINETTLPLLLKKFVRTSRYLTIGQLKQWLLLKLGVTSDFSPEDLVLYVWCDEHPVAVPPYLTLDQVEETYWSSVDCDPVFLYALQSTPVFRF